MIKGTGKTASGLPVLFLGLSGENVTRLAAGEPVVVLAADMTAMGLPALDVVLGYGRTEQDILDRLRDGGLLGRDDAPGH